MTAVSIAGLVILGVGLLMIIVGVFMNVLDWQSERGRRRQETVHVEEQNLGEQINALEKLVLALKGAREGTQLIVFGIVVLLVGGSVLGVGSL